MAVGIIAIGMVFIAGTFPAAIHFTTIATERTIAAITADEAFAKIRLYGVRPADQNWPAPTSTYQTIPYEAVSSIKGLTYEFAYPSMGTNWQGKQYFWSALCRRVDVDVNDVQVTVFVSRKIGTAAGYWYEDINHNNLFNDGVVPVPVMVGVSGVNDELTITPPPGDKTFINDGYTIVDDTTGGIYRVLERKAVSDDTIRLDRPWQGGSKVWVVPPPVNGGRYPCVAVYQKVIRF